MNATTPLIGTLTVTTAPAADLFEQLNAWRDAVADLASQGFTSEAMTTLDTASPEPGVLTATGPFCATDPYVRSVDVTLDRFSSVSYSLRLRAASV